MGEDPQRVASANGLKSDARDALHIARALLPLVLARALEGMVRLEWQRLGVWRWLLPRGPLPPTGAGQGPLARLFLSHPPTAERMARLAALAPRRGPVRIRCGAYPIAR